MKSFRPGLWLIAMLLLRFSAVGQGYTDVALDAGIFFQYGTILDYGAGVCFHDFDNDGDDDISLCQLSAAAQFYENIDGEFFAMPSISGAHSAKSMQWVDFDNDGDADLFITKSYDSPVLLERIGPWEFDDISMWSGINMPDADTFGSNWGDYNNDQLLDIYICNYNSDGIENYLYKNNGNGTFTDVTVDTNAGGGSQHSFQATFLDYDRDGWQDLFIVNDRQTSRNVMLRNNMGVFQDVTLETMGFHYIFAMSNSVADYDNDADQDIFISNNPEGHLLHRNEGDGTFTEVAEEAGIATYDHCWAGQWIDYNLDGNQDLHICCSPFWDMTGQNKMYRNTGDGSFIYDLSPGFDGDEAWSHSSAVADFNDDGIFDIFVMNSEPDVSSLWASSGSQLSYLKVSLQGTASNKDAIGSWIEIWADGEYQMRYTFCGEGYMSQNSDAEIFGLGNKDIVDSLHVTWPNGNMESYYGIATNQHLELLEGSTAHFSLGYDESLGICPGDTLLISAPEFASYLWSTGDSTQAIMITSPGTYELSAWTMMGVQVQSDSVVVEWLPSPIIDAQIQNNPCYGDTLASIQLTNEAGTGLLNCTWSFGNLGPTVNNLGFGNYLYTWVDLNGCSTDGSVEVIDPPEVEVELLAHDISCFGEHDGHIEINAFGGTGILASDWGENDPPQELGPGDYSVIVTDENGCQQIAAAFVNEPQLLELDFESTELIADELWSVEAIVIGGTEPYEYFWSTGEVDPLTELPLGDFGVWVLDDHNCAVYDAFNTTTLNIDDQVAQSTLAFPNPVDHWLNIQSIGLISSATIYSLSGQEVVHFSGINSPATTLDLSSLRSGMYMLVLKVDDTLVRRTLLKS